MTKIRGKDYDFKGLTEHVFGQLATTIANEVDSSGRMTGISIPSSSLEVAARCWPRIFNRSSKARLLPLPFIDRPGEGIYPPCLG